jgi:hypothetical protein
MKAPTYSMRSFAGVLDRMFPVTAEFAKQFVRVSAELRYTGTEA